MLPPSARTRAARDARSTFPQSHARAARCAWQGEVSKTDGQSRRSLLPFARSSLAASTNLGGASTRRASAVVGSKTLAAFGAYPASLVTVDLRGKLHKGGSFHSGSPGLWLLATNR